jgi:hypothetical protein
MVVEYKQTNRQRSHFEPIHPFGPKSQSRLKLPPYLFLALSSGSLLQNFANQNSVCIPCLLYRSPVHFAILQSGLLDGLHTRKSQASSLRPNTNYTTYVILHNSKHISELRTRAIYILNPTERYKD